MTLTLEVGGLLLCATHLNAMGNNHFEVMMDFTLRKPRLQQY